MNCPKCNEDIMSMSVHYCNSKPEQTMTKIESAYKEMMEDVQMSGSMIAYCMKAKALELESELTAVTEQRDRLAEALIKCREDSVCEQVRMEKCRYTKAADESQANIDRADKALQYLNQDQP